MMDLVKSVKLVGTKKINDKVASQIETIHSDYKSARICQFQNEIDYPDYIFEITEMDDVSFLDYVHIELLSKENDINLN